MTAQLILVFSFGLPAFWSKPAALLRAKYAPLIDGAIGVVVNIALSWPCSHPMARRPLPLPRQPGWVTLSLIWRMARRGGHHFRAPYCGGGRRRFGRGADGLGAL